ncbi:nucleotidyltransferase domain-containing protein [Pyrococcus kukulkanii]|uniref:nucleotidyltransferase domain-containing protein n=1 Tax=Pyrococcus kukulkanii TaxID=1609559 RepID=UPI0035668164
MSYLFPLTLEELTALKTCVEEFISEHEEVFDVILYGSTVLGKPNPNDVDLMILTKTRIPAVKARELVLEVKRGASRVIPRERLDVRIISLEELFDPNNLASLGIIVEGYSLTKEKPIAELMNGKAYILFRFILDGLERKERVKFQYALKGRDMRSGLLKELNGLQLGAWVVLIPIQHTYKFKEFLDLWGVKYEAFTILKGADLFYKI